MKRNKKQKQLLADNHHARNLCQNVLTGWKVVCRLSLFSPNLNFILPCVPFLFIDVACLPSSQGVRVCSSCNSVSKETATVGVLFLTNLLRYYATRCVCISQCTYICYWVFIHVSYRHCVEMWHDNVSQLKIANAMTTSAMQHYQATLLQKVLTQFLPAHVPHQWLLDCVSSFCSAITCGRRWPLALWQMQMSKQCCMQKHVPWMQRVSITSSASNWFDCLVTLKCPTLCVSLIMQATCTGPSVFGNKPL